jgi:hypothetical protein
MQLVFEIFRGLRWFHNAKRYARFLHLPERRCFISTKSQRCLEKFKNQPQPLLRQRSVNFCQHFWNLSRKKVTLMPASSTPVANSPLVVPMSRHCWKSADSPGIWIQFNHAPWALSDPALCSGVQLMGDEQTFANSKTTTPKYSWAKRQGYQIPCIFCFSAVYKCVMIEPVLIVLMIKHLTQTGLWVWFD